MWLLVHAAEFVDHLLQSILLGHGRSMANEARRAQAPAHAADRPLPRRRAFGSG
jgi:hypothetical protein